MEKTTARAKTEVESFFAVAMHRMGVKALKDADGVLTLPSTDLLVKKLPENVVKPNGTENSAGDSDEG